MSSIANDILGVENYAIYPLQWFSTKRAHCGKYLLTHTKQTESYNGEKFQAPQYYLKLFGRRHGVFTQLLGHFTTKFTYSFAITKSLAEFSHCKSAYPFSYATKQTSRRIKLSAIQRSVAEKLQPKLALNWTNGLLYPFGQWHKNRILAITKRQI